MYRVFDTPRWQCPLCGKTKDAKAQLCALCRKQSRSANRPSPEQLRRVLELHGWNFSSAGRFFRVSGNTIKRWCDTLDINKEST